MSVDVGRLRSLLSAHRPGWSDDELAGAAVTALPELLDQYERLEGAIACSRALMRDKHPTIGQLLTVWRAACAYIDKGKQGNYTATEYNQLAAAVDAARRP